jgi:hypothetical protein
VEASKAEIQDKLVLYSRNLQLGRDIGPSFRIHPLKWDGRSMKCQFRLLFLMLLSSSFLFPGCSSLYPPRTDNRDFAVDTYPIMQTAMDAAAIRARRFWARHSTKYGTQPNLLAVEAYMFNTDVLGPGFSAKINRSETTASYYAHDGFHNDSHSVTGVVIYDLKAGSLLDKTGYVFVDTPAIGTVIHIGNLVARYIGRG